MASIIATEFSLWVSLKRPAIIICCPPHDGPPQSPKGSMVALCRCSSAALPERRSVDCSHTVTLSCANYAPVMVAIRDNDGATCVLSGGDSVRSLSGPFNGASVRRQSAHTHNERRSSVATASGDSGTIFLWDGAVMCTTLETPRRC